MESLHIHHREEMMKGWSAAILAKLPVPGECKTRLAASILAESHRAANDTIKTREDANAIAADFYEVLSSAVEMV